MIWYDPDSEESVDYPTTSGLNDEQWDALRERFDFIDVDDRELRAFADMVFRAGEAQGGEDFIIHIKHRGVITAQ